MTQARDSGLSTADMVSAGEQRDPDREAGPQAQRVDTTEPPAESMGTPPDKMGTPPDRTEGEAAPKATGTPAAMDGADEKPAALLPADVTSELRSRWSEVQIGFVDEPRQAVEQADHLVAEVMKRLAEGFASERSNLEQQWGRGDEVSTEDLRIAMRRYRSFFDRLLSI
jgi:hypothetical protein